MNLPPICQRLRPWLRMALGLLLAVGACTSQAQFASPSALPATASVVNTDQVRAELLALAPDGVEPGKSFWLGLQLKHQPHWHTYWVNPGDSGLPTTLQWTLPPGLTAEDIRWPTPRKIPVGNMMNFGYEGSVLLPVLVHVGPDFHPDPTRNDLEIRLKASWLVCAKECIPQDGQFALRLPLKTSTAMNPEAFAQAQLAQPQALPKAAKVSAQMLAGRLQWSVTGLPADWVGKTLDVMPQTLDLQEPSTAVPQSWKGNTFSASLTPSSQRTQAPGRIDVLLALAGKGIQTQASLSGAWPKAADANSAPVSGVPPAALAASAPKLPGPGADVGVATAASATAALAMAPVQADGAAASTSYWVVLLGALLGGAMLNLMPCVFPVLAIKVLSLAQHGDDQRRHRVSGLAYGLGVVMSFVLLGLLLLALRAGGESLGWGFQLQDPWVVAGLAGLFTLIGLNLAGLFELGNILPVGLMSMEARHPVVNAWLTGVLAVAVASPCTAPFMGAALGVALTYPAWQALTIFAAIGVGMASPYVAASLVPAVARWLPRPGAWMDIFRKLMAFPMFATVVWLVWVLGQQSGIDGVAALLALLVALSAVVWTLSLHGRAGRALLGACVLLLILVGVNLGPRIGQVTAKSLGTAATGERWQVWSPTQVEQTLGSGRPVFVDFTAAWCVTCQYNKKTTLADASVLADFDAKRVQLLRADWTRRDPQITAALSHLGRSGVPVYVLYRPHQAPVLLSELISPAEVRAALAGI